MASIKRDVKKKVLPRPKGEKILSRDPAHFTVRVVLLLGCLPFLYLSSSGGDHANRVLRDGKRDEYLRATIVLSEARGLSLFLVLRGGIACNG
jgi:hypothetical protein